MAGNSNVHTPGTARVTRSSIKDHLSVQKSGLVPTTPLLAAKRRIAATDTKKARNDVDSSPVLGREPRKRPRLSLGSDLTVGHGVSADEFRPKGINLEKSLIEARSENVADTDAVVNIADAVPLPRESPDLALPVIRKQAEEVTPDKLKKISITTPNIQDAKKLDSKLQLRDLKAPALSSSAITIHSKRSFDDFVSSDVYLTHVKTKTAEITSLDTTSKTHIFSAPLRPINQPAYKKYQSLVLSGPIFLSPPTMNSLNASLLHSSIPSVSLEIETKRVCLSVSESP
ncbi:hypothetical protein BC829DRAFT_231710 [Chytridium lagenaria]|nr:hypothetical protein BC829DRAFT_231710 [Chytridium lagenaria]